MNNRQNCAEVMDLMNSRIAIGLLVASFAYALDAGSLLISTESQSMMNWLSFAVSMVAVLLIIWAIGPSLWKKLKSRSVKLQEPESFITESFHQAIIKSWIITLLALVVLKSLEQFVIKVGLPADFYFRALIFVMLFSASVIFLVSTYVSDDVDKNEELA